MNKEPAEKILATLPHFTGTEHWYRYQPRLLLTDGAKYIADACEAYWLLDCIWSYMTLPGLRDEDFWVVKLQVHEDDGATITITDGNNKHLFTQKIEYTDFPLPKITLWAIWDGENRTIMLPSEY